MKYCYVLLLILFSIKINAQSIGNSYKVEFSQLQTKGYTSDIVYSTESHLFVLFSDVMVGQSSKSKYRVEKVDKQTFETVGTVDLEEVLEELDFSSFEMISEANNSFFFIFSTGKRKERSIAAINIDQNLRITGKINSIISLNEKTTRWAVRTNPQSGRLAFLTQDKRKKGDNSVINYKIYDQNLKELKAGSFSSVLSKNMEGEVKNVATLYGFKLMNNSNLVSITTPSSDEINEDESSTLNERIIMCFNPFTGETVKKGIRLGDDRALLNVTSFLNDDKLVVAGFFGDNAEEGIIFKSTDQDINGIFMMEFKDDLSAMTQERLTTFNAEMVEQLKKDYVNGRRDLKGKEDKKRKRIGDTDDEEGLSTNYSLVKLLYSDEDLVYVMEQERNYMTSSTTTDANGNTRTTYTYHAIRGSVFTVSVSSIDGTVNWYDSFQKYVHYTSGSSNIYNTRVLYPVMKGGKLILLYRTSYKFIEGQEKAELLTGSFEVPFFTRKIDLADGKSKVFEPLASNDKLENYERFTMVNYYIDPIDNAIYCTNSKYKMKPVRVALLTVGYLSIIGAYPAYIVTLLTKGKSRKELFTYGKLTLLD